MGLRSRLRRPDWLGELQTLVVIVAVIVTVFLALRIGNATIGSNDIPVNLEARSLVGAVDAQLGDGRVRVYGDSVVEAAIARPSSGQVLLYVLTWLPTGLLMLVVFALLFRTVREGRSSDPFTTRTVRRLRTIAWLAVVGGEVVSIVETLAGLALADSVLPKDASRYATLELPMAWLFGGFVLLAVSELIRRGVLMREELAGVV